MKGLQVLEAQTRLEIKGNQTLCCVSAIHQLKVRHICIIWKKEHRNRISILSMQFALPSAFWCQKQSMCLIAMPRHLVFISHFWQQGHAQNSCSLMAVLFLKLYLCVFRTSYYSNKKSENKNAWFGKTWFEKFKAILNFWLCIHAKLKLTLSMPWDVRTNGIENMNTQQIDY